MPTLQLRTERREQMIDVTSEVAGVVREATVEDGWVLVYCPHTTAGVCVNEHADADVATDVLTALRTLVPQQAGWLHTEGNSDAHAKAILVGESAMVPIVSGRLKLGTWQGVFFCEFDGPRTRELHVTAARA